MIGCSLGRSLGQCYNILDVLGRPKSLSNKQITQQQRWCRLHASLRGLLASGAMRAAAKPAKQMRSCMLCHAKPAKLLWAVRMWGGLSAAAPLALWVTELFTWRWMHTLLAFSRTLFSFTCTACCCWPSRVRYTNSSTGPSAQVSYHSTNQIHWQ